MSASHARIRFGLISALAATLVSFGSAVAVASPPSKPAATPEALLLATTVHPGRIVTSAPSATKSMSIAGYVGPVSGDSDHDITYFTAFLVVPKINCATSPASSTIIDIGFNGSVAGGASASSGGEVVLSCSGTTPVYMANLFVDNMSAPSEPVAGGDRLVFTGYASPTLETYAIKDINENVTTHDVGSGLTAQNLQMTAQCGFGDGGFPPFTTIKFSNLHADQMRFSKTMPTAYSEVDASNRVIVRASDLGKTFHLTYLGNT